MRFPNAAIVERLRNQYPAGTRVELLEMHLMDTAGMDARFALFLSRQKL